MISHKHTRTLVANEVEQNVHYYEGTCAADAGRTVDYNGAYFMAFICHSALSQGDILKKAKHCTSIMWYSVVRPRFEVEVRNDPSITISIILVMD